MGYDDSLSQGIHELPFSLPLIPHSRRTRGYHGTAHHNSQHGESCIRF